MIPKFYHWRLTFIQFIEHSFLFWVHACDLPYLVLRNHLFPMFITQLSALLFKSLSLKFDLYSFLWSQFTCCKSNHWIESISFFLNSIVNVYVNFTDMFDNILVLISFFFFFSFMKQICLIIPLIFCFQILKIVSKIGVVIQKSSFIFLYIYLYIFRTNIFFEFWFLIFFKFL